MNLMEAIYGRRSIRSYTDEEVSDENLKTILSAGMNAPSGMNAEPWRFIIIRDKNTLKKIGEIKSYAKMAEKAPIAILICADVDAQKIPDMWIIDCSACIQNMLLTIHDLNLGGVWTGVYPNEKYVKEFGKLCNLPKNIKAHSLVILGHSAEKKPKNNKFHKDFIHYEKWKG